MTDYNNWATNPKQFHVLTGYMMTEFAALVPTFSVCYETQMQTATLAVDPGGGRISAMTSWFTSGLSFDARDAVACTLGHIADAYDHRPTSEQSDEEKRPKTFPVTFPV